MFFLFFLFKFLRLSYINRETFTLFMHSDMSPTNDIKLECIIGFIFFLTFYVGHYMFIGEICLQFSVLSLSLPDFVLKVIIELYNEFLSSQEYL